MCQQRFRAGKNNLYHFPTIVYDATGRLYSSTYNGTQTQFLYDGDELIAEYNGSGTLLRRYVHGVGTDDPLVQYNGSGTANKVYLLADERGSIIAELGNSQIINKYGPYGEPMNTNGSRFRYTGQILLPGTELYHYKARVYHPKLGRFMQTDPIGYKDGMNWYAYVGNDPVNLVDPLGLCGRYKDVDRGCAEYTIIDFSGGNGGSGETAKRNNSQLTASERRDYIRQIGGSGGDILDAIDLTNDLLMSDAGIQIIKQMFPKLASKNNLILQYRIALNQDSYYSNGNSLLGLMGTDAAHMNITASAKFTVDAVHSIWTGKTPLHKINGLIGAARDLSSRGNVNSMTVLKFYGDQWLAGDPPL